MASGLAGGRADRGKALKAFDSNRHGVEVCTFRALDVGSGSVFEASDFRSKSYIALN
jgi:hypothetical protein